MYVKVNLVIDGKGIIPMEGELEPVINMAKRIAKEKKAKEFLLKCQTRKHIFGIWKKNGTRWVREW
ncbi:MAG: hypothetical protein IIY21_04695 [Clostridiales bacterium]|nr:hypothetical protein [Clostridiales bacterium]MBQ1573814.1 hypothetical protein [Clostridiales bacterium]